MNSVDFQLKLVPGQQPQLLLLHPRRNRDYALEPLKGGWGWISGWTGKPGRLKAGEQLVLGTLVLQQSPASCLAHTSLCPAWWHPTPNIKPRWLFFACLVPSCMHCAKVRALSRAVRVLLGCRRACGVPRGRLPRVPQWPHCGVCIRS